MNLVTSIIYTLRLLKNSKYNNDFRILNYKLLISNMNKVCTTGTVIVDSEIATLIHEITKEDLVNHRAIELRMKALDTLRLFSKCQKEGNVEIREDVMAIALRELATTTHELKESAESCFKSNLSDVITKSGTFPIEKILQNLSTLDEQLKFAEVFSSVFCDLPIKKKIVMFYEVLIPALYSTHGDIREFTYLLISNVPEDIQVMLRKKEFSTKHKTNIKEYISNIRELQSLQDATWSRQFTTLVQFSETLIPSDLSITNMFLKIAEEAFRSQHECVQVAGYDCWGAIIDAFCSDLKYICTLKVLTVTLAPLKKRFEPVILIEKQLDQWLHLISILKQKANEHVLPEFLNFCFGGIREISFITQRFSQKQYPAQLFWKRILAAIFEITGHFEHDLKDNCFKHKYGTSFKLDNPLLDSNFMKVNAKVIINAIGASSLLVLKQLGNTDKSKIISCVWGSLFVVVKQMDEKDQESILTDITLLLGYYIQTVGKSSPSLHIFLELILELLLSKNFFSSVILNNIIILPLLKTYVKHGNLTALCNGDILTKLFSFGRSLNPSSTSKWFKMACDILDLNDIKNTSCFSKIWFEMLFVARNILSYERDIDRSHPTIRFLTWPLIHCPPEVKKEEFFNVWCDMLKDICKEDPFKASLLLQNLQLELQLTKVPNAILHMLSLLSTQIKDSLYKPLVTVVFDLAKDVFCFKFNNDTEALMVQAFKSNQNKISLLGSLKNLFSLTSDDDVVNDSNFAAFCMICENIISHQGPMMVLDVLQFLADLPNPYLVQVPDSLIKTVRPFLIHSMGNLKTQAAIFLAKKKSSMDALGTPQKDKTLKITEAFQVQGKSVLKSSNAKLDTELIKSPKITPQKDKTLKITEPFKVQGRSVPKSTTAKLDNELIKNLKTEQKHKKELPKSNIDSDDTACFVLINDHYNYDATKLSDHQLERLQERSDIPALYQDLSQSQTGSQCVTKIASEAQKLYSSKDAADGSTKSNGIFNLIALEPKNIVSQSPPTPIASTSTDSVDINQTPTSNKPKRRIALTHIVESTTEIDKNGRLCQESTSNKPKRRIALTHIVDSTKEIDKNGRLSQESTSNKPKRRITLTHIESTKDIDKKSRVYRELQKIKMDIVGGDTHLKVDLSERRKTRKSSGNAPSGVTSNLEGDKITPKIKPTKKDKAEVVINKKDDQKTQAEVVIGKKESDPKTQDKAEVADKKESDTKTQDKAEVAIGKKETDLKTQDKAEVVVDEKESDRKTQDNAEVVIDKKESDPKTQISNTKLSNPVVDTVEKQIQSKHIKKVKLPVENNAGVTLKQIKKKHLNSITLFDLKKRSTSLIEEKRTEMVADCNDEQIENNDGSTESKVSSDTDGNTSDTDNNVIIIEDVIESSQESPKDFTLYKGITPAVGNTKQSNSSGTDNNCFTEEPETSNLIDCNEFSPDQIMQIHVLKNKALTTEEISIAEADTVSELDSLSNEIATSPVSSDTPIRTKNFIENTNNISPIKLFSQNTQSSPISSGTNNISLIHLSLENDKNENHTEKTPDLFDSESCRTDVAVNGKENVQDDIHCKPSDILQKPDTRTPSASGFLTNRSSRAHCILKLTNSNALPVKQSKSFEIPTGIKNRTPQSFKSHRVVKIMENYLPEDNGENSQDVIEIQESDEQLYDIPENNLLRFVCNVPSPMASPRCSILKRKAPESVDEGLSPPRKKRVSFPDPPLTGKKLFIKGSHEYLKSPWQKSGLLKDGADSNNSLIDKKLHRKRLNDKTATCETTDFDVINWNDPTINVIEIDDALDDFPEDIPESEGSMNLVNPHLLEHTKPICPELLNCDKEIEDVMKELTSTSCLQSALDECSRRHISTIGDLAKLTELEISRLPIKSSKIEHVRNILVSYCVKEGILSKNLIECDINNEFASTAKISKVHDDAINYEGNQPITPDLKNKTSDTTIKNLKRIGLTDASPASKRLCINDRNTTNLTESEPKIGNVSKVSKLPKQNNEELITKTTPTDLVNNHDDLDQQGLLKDTPMDESSENVDVIPGSEISDDVNCLQKSRKEDENPDNSFVKDGLGLEMKIPRLSSVENIKSTFEIIITQARNQGLQMCLGNKLVDMIGMDVLISIVMEYLKLEGNQNSLISLLTELLSQLGWENFISVILELPEASTDLIVGICNSFYSGDENGKYYLSLAKSQLSHTEIIKTFNLDNILDALFSKYKDNDFMMEDLFSKLTLMFSPSLKDFTLSFQNITVVNLNGNPIELNNSERTNLNDFIRKVLPSKDSDVMSVVPKDQMLQNYSCDELVNALDKFIPSEMTTLIKGIISNAEDNEESLNNIMLAVIGKYSIANVVQYIFKYLSKHGNDCNIFSQNST